MVARQLKESVLHSGRSQLLFLLGKTGSQRRQPAWKCKCKRKYLAVLQQWCQCIFYFMINSPAPNTRTRGGVRAYDSASIHKCLVERHKSSLTADNHLAYNVLQKTSSTRKVFSFCQSFQSGTDLQTRAQMAAE